MPRGSFSPDFNLKVIVPGMDCQYRTKLFALQTIPKRAFDVHERARRRKIVAALL
jgi:hypothetical protein